MPRGMGAMPIGGKPPKNMPSPNFAKPLGGTVAGAVKNLPITPMPKPRAMRPPSRRPMTRPMNNPAPFVGGGMNNPAPIQQNDPMAGQGPVSTPPPGTPGFL